MDGEALQSCRSRGYCVLTLSPDDAAVLKAALAGTECYFSNNSTEERQANRLVELLTLLQC